MATQRRGSEATFSTAAVHQSKRGGRDKMGRRNLMLFATPEVYIDGLQPGTHLPNTPAEPRAATT